LTRGDRILKTDLFDVAFNTNPFLFDLARGSSDVIGIDVSRKVVGAVRKRAELEALDAGRYLCCDVRHIPLKEDSIDLIISDSTLDHFPHEIDVVDALKELRRVLKPGGTLILTIDNKNNLTYPPYWLIRLWMRFRMAPFYIGKTLSISQLRSTMEEIGFSVEESTAIFHSPHPDALVRWLERVLRWLSRGRLDDAIRKSLVAFDKLGEIRTRYLTGRYIAVKAVKRGTVE
jgi:ubiquinone/menaquinone biosynthesis C-methylase UbiE